MAKRVPLNVRNPRLFQARASATENGVNPDHAQSLYLKYGVTDFSEYDEEVYDAPTFGRKFGDKYNEDGSLVERCEGCNKPTCICEEETKTVVEKVSDAATSVTETVSDAASMTVETTTSVAKAVVNAPIEGAKAVGKGTVAAATMTKDATIAVATAPIKGAKAVTDAIGLTTKEETEDEQDISDDEVQVPDESQDAEPEELTWNQFRTMHRGYKRGQISQLWKYYKKGNYDPYSKDSKKKIKRQRRLRL